MSRVAKSPVNLPSGVEFKVDGQQVTVKGGKGSLEHEVHELVAAVGKLERDNRRLKLAGAAVVAVLLAVALASVFGGAAGCVKCVSRGW